MKFIKTPYIQHYAGLKLCTLSANGYGEYNKTNFYWEFDVKPSKFSKIYRILLIWDFKYKAPKVFILNNEVVKVGKTRIIPHLYDREKIQLCLYYPQYSEYNELMPLCDTIIPWTYRWLQYYEEWLYSNEWKGGDAPHPVSLNVESEDEIIHEISNSTKYIKKSTIDKIYSKRKKIFDLN